MRPAVRSYIVGLHNPILHSLVVGLSWIKLFRRLPSLKETLCIILHDVGYLRQTTIDGDDNRHPELGANMCKVFGEKYYDLCILHSRDYARKLKKPLSILGYADKHSALLYPNWFFRLLIIIGGEANEYHKSGQYFWGYPINICLIKKDYREWIDRELDGQTLQDFQKRS